MSEQTDLCLSEFMSLFLSQVRLNECVCCVDLILLKASLVEVDESQSGDEKDVS